MCQAELAALLVSVRSNSRRTMGLQQSLNNELFIEQIPYIPRIRYVEGFIKEKGYYGYKYIVLGRDIPYFSSMYSDSNK
jgi:hypothetical protein